MKRSTFVWGGLAILITVPLMNYLQRLEIAKVYENYWSARSTTTSAMNGATEFQNNAWSEETIGNYGSPYGSDYWCQWDNLIGYTAPCSQDYEHGLQTLRERGQNGLGAPRETTRAELQHKIAEHNWTLRV